MFNLSKENVGEHSHEVSIFAHGIAVIGVHDYQRTYNPERIATIGIYHELSESVLGDQPSTLKHATSNTTAFFKGIESKVEGDIVNTLPESIKEHMASVTLASRFTIQERDIVKAADLLSMLLKCEHELSLNNREFTNAKEKIETKLQYYFSEYPETLDFYLQYMSKCQQTIDGLVSL